MPIALLLAITWERSVEAAFDYTFLISIAGDVPKGLRSQNWAALKYTGKDTADLSSCPGVARPRSAAAEQAVCTQYDPRTVLYGKRFRCGDGDGVSQAES